MSKIFYSCIILSLFIFTPFSRNILANSPEPTTPPTTDSDSHVNSVSNSHSASELAPALIPNAAKAPAQKILVENPPTTGPSVNSLQLDTSTQAAAMAQTPTPLLVTRQETPLELAIIEDEFYEVEKLLQQGNSADGTADLAFPLIFAVIKNNLGIAELLLKSGANPNKKMPNGLTALHWAVFHNQVDMVKTLLKFGADTQIPLNGATPYQLAIEANYQEISELLKTP